MELKRKQQTQLVIKRGYRKLLTVANNSKEIMILKQTDGRAGRKANRSAAILLSAFEYRLSNSGEER